MKHSLLVVLIQRIFAVPVEDTKEDIIRCVEDEEEEIVAEIYPSIVVSASYCQNIAFYHLLEEFAVNHVQTIPYHNKYIYFR